MKKIIFLVLIILSSSIFFLGCVNSSKISDSQSINTNSNTVTNDNNKPQESNKIIDSTKNNLSNSQKFTSSTNNNKSKKNLSSKKEILLKNIKNKALEGKVIDSNFKLEDLIGNVINKLGNPSSKNYVADAKGEYFNFNSYNLSFGVNKGDVIFEIRSLNKTLNNLDLKDIENFFGKPNYSVRTKLKETIIGYVLKDNIKILFVFDTQTSKLKHYSILDSNLTKNSMANDNGRNW